MVTKLNKNILFVSLSRAFVCLFMLISSTALFPKNVAAKISLNYEERKLIDEINDYRKTNGLNALEVSGGLSESSLAMTRDMAKNPDSLNNQHKDSKGRSADQRAARQGYSSSVKENLAAGYKTASKVFQAWKESNSHKENMLNPNNVVIGLSRTASGNDYGWYWSCNFGEVEQDKDTLREIDYAPMKKIKIAVSSPEGQPVNKARVSVYNKGGNRLTSALVNKKGRRTIWVAPRETYFVRASATGYNPYTMKVLPKNKKKLKLNLWLER